MPPHPRSLATLDAREQPTSVFALRLLNRGAPALSDAQLVDGVAVRSHEALAEIYARYGAAMRRLARQLRGSSCAEDVVQDVFLRLWARPWLFDPARGSLRRFLMMQTRARAIDQSRSDASRRVRESKVVADLSPVSRPVDDGALARLQADDARRLLAGLSSTERTAIALAYFGDHTYREVALLLGQPEGTIKTRIRSALGQLRHAMVATQRE